MNKILCPTDFSKAANNGMEYAARLARSSGAELTLIHAQDVPIMYQENSSIAIMNSTFQQRKEILEQLNVDCLAIMQEFNIQCQFDIQPFDLNKTMQEKTGNSPLYDLIVMGTNGADGMREFFSGTHSYHVAKNVKCPILIVPEDYSFKDINNIVFASDYSQNDKSILKDLNDIAGHFNPQICLLHISKKDTLVSREVYRVFCNIVKEDLVPNLNLTFQRIVNQDEAEGIENYIHENKTDLLVLSMKQHNYIFKLFHKNLIMEMTFFPDYPILIFNT